MGSVEDPFESSEFLLRRARVHFDNFEKAAAEYLNSDAYTVWHELNETTGLKEVKLKIVREFPEDLRGYASDAIKNIKDALDQAMSAASYVVSGKRSKRTHFPFGEDADDLENSLSRRKAGQCKGIPEELFPAIRYIRPYPHEGDRFRLKLLQKVSGPHKHSVSLALGIDSPSPFAKLDFIAENSVVVASVNFPEWDTTNDEVVVATYSGDGKPILSHAFQIEFSHPDLRGVSAWQLLSGWGGRAEWIVRGLKETATQIAGERRN
ncbi:MAG: hypothetical protein AAFQ36_04735 [Pseudomonadota bacterium]